MIFMHGARKTFQEAIDTYGKELQTTIFFEEIAELQKEICKNLRGKNNEEAIAEEMADVYIMLQQLKMMYNIEQSLVEHYAQEKISRLRERIERAHDE